MDKGERVRLEETVFRSLDYANWVYYLFVGLLVAVVGWAGFAFFNQIYRGLGVTGLGQPVTWGIYITNFVFFIGISHAGTLISAILRVTGAEWRRPITRAAEAITVFALILGATNIMVDMGRPDRLINFLRYGWGRVQSPLIWDVVSITVYLISSIIYLYLPLIPDVAILRDRQGLPAWRKWLYSRLSLGWSGTEKQKHRLERAIGIMAILIIPIAVSVHTVVSWVFAMTIQPMWHSTIFGPYFVVGAIFSGIASIIIVMAVIRRVFGLQDYLTPRHFNNLGLLLLTMSLFWFYFTFAEYLTEFYGGEPIGIRVLSAKISGEFAPIFWVMVFFCFIIPFVILINSRTRTIAGTVIASVLINIGMWLERFTIVVPTLTRTRLPYEFVVYRPSWVEWSLLAGCLAGFALLYAIFARLFPIISIWEIREGEEVARSETGHSGGRAVPPAVVPGGAVAEAD